MPPAVVLAKQRGADGTPPPLPLVLMIAATLVAVLPLSVDAQGFRGIPGNFCRNRKPSECCTDREDDCAVPIRGTLCYCDEFCLNKDDEVNLVDDCCPDFREVCLGERPKGPQQWLPSDDPGSYNYGVCEGAGFRIRHGETLKFNCIGCTCAGGKLKCETEECMIEKELMEEINGDPRRYGWRAANYTHFWGRKVKEGLLLRTGTSYPDTASMAMHPIIQRVNTSLIPDQFDSRTRREWQGRVSPVRDQGWCGASWVFSTLDVTQDRLSILATGADPIQLSPQNLLSCANLGQQGCKGGHIERAWNYIRHKGVVEEQCHRYESGASGKLPPCPSQGSSNPGLTCKNPHLYRMESAYRISSKEEDIQWEILMNGPVQAMMKVHRDFFMYKTGVYRFSGLTPADTATHSVRIVGWGKARMPGSQPVKYWVVANSWGRWWGERGYFKILRGANESGIESFVLAARGRLANYMYGHKSG